MIPGTVCAVLKTGGDFGPEHGDWLKQQVRKHYPDWNWRLYTDLYDKGVGTDSLRLGLPRWWSKYEAYADRTLTGPVLMLDLDVVILRPWLPPDPTATYLVADSNRLLRPGERRFIGAFAYLQDSDRRLLAEDFFKNPVKAMATKNSDDQPRLTTLLPHAQTVQHSDPDGVVLFKVHVASMGIQPGNKIVLFHGKPRPWESGLAWVPTLE